MDLFFLFVVGMVIASTRPADAPKHAWDLSKSQGIEQVGWPPNLRGDMDMFYDVMAEGPVRITLPGGRVFEHSVERVSFSRLRDRIFSVRLVFYDQTIEDAYATARGLAKAWGIPTTKLVAWKQVVKDEWSGSLMIMRTGCDPGFSIDIRNTYDPKTPFHIQFVIAWDITPLLPKSATKPTTQATQPSTKPTKATTQPNTRPSKDSRKR